MPPDLRAQCPRAPPAILEALPLSEVWFDPPGERRYRTSRDADEPPQRRTDAQRRRLAATEQVAHPVAGNGEPPEWQQISPAGRLNAKDGIAALPGESNPARQRDRTGEVK